MCLFTGTESSRLMGGMKMFHKKKQEMACKNSLLKNIEELKEKAIQWDRLAEAAEELSNENQFLKEEQEKLRIKLWHQGYEYDRLISDLELNQIEKELPWKPE